MEPKTGMGKDRAQGFSVSSLMQICEHVRSGQWSDDAQRAAAYGIHDLAHDALGALHERDLRHAARCIRTAGTIANDYGFAELRDMARDVERRLRSDDHSNSDRPRARGTFTSY